MAENSWGDRILSWVVIYITVVVIGMAGGWLILVNPAEDFERVARRVDGVVTGTACDNHGEVDYRFGADGREVKGSNNPEDRCDAAMIGHPIPVWYRPEDPEVNQLWPPAESVTEAREIALIAPVVFGAMGLVVLIAGRRKTVRPPP